MGIVALFLFAAGAKRRRKTPKSEGTVTRKERELEALLAPTVRAFGCELWGVEYRPWGRGRSTLRVFIDSDRGITVDDCERVSAQVGAVLDVENPIVESYRLEVSSPGLDRLLFRREQYESRVGCRVNVRLTFPFEGRRRFEGRLVGVRGDHIVLRSDEDAAEHLLPFEQIQRARIVPEFHHNANGAATPRTPLPDGAC